MCQYKAAVLDEMIEETFAEISLFEIGIFRIIRDPPDFLDTSPVG